MRFSVDNLAECPRYESLAIAIEQNDSRNVALEGLRDRRERIILEIDGHRRLEAAPPAPRGPQTYRTDGTQW